MRHALLVALLTGCLQRHAPLRAAAKAERSEAEGAENRWATALQGPLADTEWATAHRHLCRLRGERITATVDGLEPGDLPLEQVRALRSELVHCAGWGETKAHLLGMQEGIALAKLEAIHPSKDHEQLVTAAPWVRLLSKRSSVRDGYDGWRSAYLEHLETLDVGPVTSEHLQVLRGEAGGGEPGDDPSAAAAALEMHVSTVESTSDASCGGSSSGLNAQGEGLPIEMTVHLSDCSSTEESVQVDVPYSVEKFRWEKQTRQVTKYNYVKVPQTVATGQQRCYQISDTHQSCHSDTKTVYTTKRVPYEETVTQDVKVTYYERYTREETRFRRTDVGTVVLTVHSADGTATWTTSASRTHDHVSPASSNYRDLLEDETAEAAKAGVAAVRQQRVAEFTSSDLTRSEGIERRLIAQFAGEELTGVEASQMASTLGLPSTSFLLERPSLGDVLPTPLPTDKASVHNSHGEGVLRFGFPVQLGTLGVGRAYGTDALEAHPAARSYNLTFRLDINVPVVVRTPLGKVGFHPFMHGALHVGWRSQSRYDFPTPQGPESRKEPVIARGADGSVGLLAGTRNAAFGVFGGMMARSFFAGNGFTKAGGRTLPFAGRLELRPRARYPLIVTAWAFPPLSDVPEDTYGAHVSWPLFRGGWLTAEFTQDQARTQVLGLNDTDVVDAGLLPHRRIWVGFGGAIF